MATGEELNKLKIAKYSKKNEMHTFINPFQRYDERHNIIITTVWHNVDIWAAGISSQFKCVCMAVYHL